MRKLRILVACEESQTITKVLRGLGHEAFSCDLLPCSGGHPEWHIQGDVFRILEPMNNGWGMKDGINFTTQDETFRVIGKNWDMMIAHPPCTYLSVSGARWMYHPEDKHLETSERRPHPKFPNRRKQQLEALDFVQKLMDAPIDKIAIENPVSVISSKIRKPDQIVEPFHFGDPHNKKTCLWLKNLPLLKHTNIVEPQYIIGKRDGKRYSMIHYMSVGMSKGERSKVRSKTFPGIAEAIAKQWTVDNSGDSLDK